MVLIGWESSILVGVLLVTLYCYLMRNYKYWSDRGVKFVKPMPIVGSFIDYIMRRKTIGEIHKDIYNANSNEPFVGLYRFFTPDLLIIDPEIIKRVLVTDFKCFQNRINAIHGKPEVLLDNMFSAQYDRWKVMRQKVTPTFTSGKLRNMFKLILDVADEYTKYLDYIIVEGDVKNVCEVTAKFTTDVIGSCAFVINMNSMLDENAPFRKIGRRIFDLKPLQFIKFAMRILSPGIFTILRLKVHDKDVEDFFRSTIRDIAENRERNQIKRHDFIDMMLEQKAKDQEDDMYKIDEDFIVSQAFTFFGAGFETSSTLMSFALYELAMNREVQDKLYQEISDFLLEIRGRPSYDGVIDLPYLEMVICETMRKYPACGAILRTSTASYTFEGTNLKIDKDISITIPVLALHHDPKYYPDPDKFIPERFSPEGYQLRDPMVYLPFGDGPRNCIGELIIIFYV